MKIGMKEQMGVANEMTYFFWDCARAARAFLREAHKFTHFHGFWGKSGSKNCRRVMKIGMKEEMGVADEMTSSVLGSRAQRTHLCTKCANPLNFMVWGGKWQQELSEGHENWHEGEDGRCRRNGIISLGIASTHCALLRPQRALRAQLPC